MTDSYLLTCRILRSILFLAGYSVLIDLGQYGSPFPSQQVSLYLQVRVHEKLFIVDSFVLHSPADYTRRSYDIRVSSLACNFTSQGLIGVLYSPPPPMTFASPGRNAPSCPSLEAHSSFSRNHITYLRLLWKLKALLHLMWLYLSILDFICCF